MEDSEQELFSILEQYLLELSDAMEQKTMATQD